MKKRSILEIVKEIKVLLMKEKELSIQRIANRTKTQWRVAHKALEFLKDLKIVEERRDAKTNTRFFRLR